MATKRRRRSGLGSTTDQHLEHEGRELELAESYLEMAKRSRSCAERAHFAHDASRALGASFAHNQSLPGKDRGRTMRRYDRIAKEIYAFAEGLCPSGKL